MPSEGFDAAIGYAEGVVNVLKGVEQLANAGLLPGWNQLRQAKSMALEFLSSYHEHGDSVLMSSLMALNTQNPFYGMLTEVFEMEKAISGGDLQRGFQHLFPAIINFASYIFSAVGGAKSIGELRSSAGITTASKEVMTKPGSCNPANEFMQKKIVATKLEESNKWVMESQFKNNQGLDLVAANPSGSKVLVGELKVITGHIRGSIEQALSRLKNSRYGLQLSEEFVGKQATRLRTSPKSTPEMRQAGGLIQNANKVDRILYVMDEFGEIYSYDFGFYEMYLW